MNIGLRSSCSWFILFKLCFHVPRIIISNLLIVVLNNARIIWGTHISSLDINPTPLLIFYSSIDLHWPTTLFYPHRLEEAFRTSFRSSIYDMSPNKNKWFNNYLKNKNASLSIVELALWAGVKPSRFCRARKAFNHLLANTIFLEFFWPYVF